jgi:hypothetical protein
MKNLIIILIICVIYGLSTSCEKMFGDFLNKAPGVDVTIDTLFSSKIQLEKYLATTYEIGMQTEYPYNNPYVGGSRYSSHNDNNYAHYANSCDEGENGTSWYASHSWNAGSMTVGSMVQEDRKWVPRWNTIRLCYTLINRVDEVPDIDATYKEQVKGEAKWLIACSYFEMFKRRGGVPLVYDAFDVALEIPKIQRSSVDSVVKFIVKLCDEAAAVLPDAWPSNWKGRITKGAALGLKARTLLWAASPLFNTATPYLDMPDPADNRLICYTNFDINRWKDAADAAKAVLDWAPSGGIQLITDKGVDKNYKWAWETMDNSEIIIADKVTDRVDKTPYGSMPWSMCAPNGIYGSWGGVSVTQNFVEKFYDNRFTGKPIVWYASGTDLNQKYDSMDYRFKQSVAYNGSYYSINRPFIELWTGGSHTSLCATGYWMRKFVPDAYTGSVSSVSVNWPYLRLNEFYLQYAEALNEFNAAPPPEAYTRVNDIRARSGMPPLPAGLTKDQFRDRVRKEWGVEFAFENKRFWDIRRWLIAEQDGVMQGAINKITITKGAALPAGDPFRFQFSYSKGVLENRSWNRWFYLLGFSIDEVNKGYLKQNPGW